jgi:hypothetical protein
MWKRKDYTGQKIHKLTMIKPTDQRVSGGGIIWETLCECGNTMYIVPNDISPGTNCGCMKRIGNHKLDHTGRKIHRVTIVKETMERSNGAVLWEALCECGKTILVIPNAVNPNTSCGCVSFATDYTGQKIHRFTMLKPTNKRYKKSVIWEAQCECGNIIDVLPRQIKPKTNCGCLKQKTTKICCICKIEKNIDEFIKNKTQCKECIKEYQKIYRQKKKAERKEKSKIYYKRKVKSDPSFKLRKNISRTVYRALRLRGSSKKGKSCFPYLSWTIQELKDHIENQFEPWMNWENQGHYKPETWDDNDTTTWKWQLDHIIPHSTFQYTTMDCQEFRDCWDLSNLRPLSAKQNLFDGISRIRHISS